MVFNDCLQFPIRLPTGFQALSLHTPFPCLSSAVCAYASATEFCPSRCCGSFQPPFEKDAGRAEAMDDRFVVRRWTERCPVAPSVFLGGDGPKGRKLEAIIGWCYFLMSLQLSGHPLPPYINLIFPRCPPLPPPISNVEREGTDDGVKNFGRCKLWFLGYGV